MMSRKTLTLSPLMVAAILLFAPQFQTAFAQQPRGSHSVKRRVLIRTAPQSWSLGVLVPGNGFDVQYSDDTGRFGPKGYAWGRAYFGPNNRYSRCVWVRLNRDTLEKRNPQPAPGQSCGSPRRLSIDRYARKRAPAMGYPCSAFNQNNCLQGQQFRLTHPARVKLNVPMTELYANYNWRTRRVVGPPLITLSGGDRIGWRWTTKDGRAAMVRHDPSGTWGFIALTDMELIDTANTNQTLK